MAKSSVKRAVISAVIGTVLTAILFYFWLPAINPLDPSFWIFLGVATLTYFIPYLISGGEKLVSVSRKGIEFSKKNKNGGKKKKTVGTVIFIVVLCVVFGVLILGTLISSTFFNARRYAGIIDVREAVFSDDMPKQTDATKNIALMDSDSARVIGNRALDQLADVVSQFVAGESYTQINYHGLPKKVTSLEYDGFFKWLNNKEVGIPGYIMVDPVENNANYIKLTTPLKYVDSGYFGDDLYRKLRFEYPTKIFDFISYEIDENGKPFYVVSCVSPKIFPFGGFDVDEVIIFDPCTGESSICSVDNTPSWVDAVYSGDLAVKKYDWYGTLSGGFINSIIGNKGCKITTDDYGYITLGDDVWYYTGVTSVTADSSNIGFILTNARTGEYKYYAVGGAEEHTAMEAAQGEVAHMGYTASFPSLINIEGEATYIMVLKDNYGSVKLYALVNVEDYMVGIATGKTQTEAMEAYRARLIQEGILKEDTENVPEKPENPTAQFEISSIKNAVISGNSVIYLMSEDGMVYRGVVGENEMLVWLNVGDKIEVEYAEDEISDGVKVRNIISFKKAE